MKKIGAAACAMLLSICMLTGCGQTAASSSDGENIAQADMPYGSTLTVDSSGTMAISYDHRFLEQDLLNKIIDYYLAIQEQDGEKFGSLMFPLYHQYQLETVYEGEADDQTIVQNTHDAIEEYFGFDFEYAFIDITNLVSELGDSEGLDALRLMLDQLADEQGTESISENTQALYELTITRHLDKKGENTKSETINELKDETLFAIKYEDQWYLMYS